MIPLLSFPWSRTLETAKVTVDGIGDRKRALAKLKEVAALHGIEFEEDEGDK